ncbi:MAG: LysM peptidoglycan-binding domain-containing protein [Candidatus Omnitrophica bacterium]|nr:LysM peptidoglycan-binding domain-containing protein [Candidatus Omnitrophota bacterium]
MKDKGLYLLLGLAVVVVLSGCTVRTYSLTRDRVDQDLTSGNRGYLQGTPPAEEVERSSTRTVQVVEVELGRPVKLKERQKGQETGQMPQETVETYESEALIEEVAEPQAAFERYTVQKGDTLQKISQKFFGTTKKWTKIYEANRDVLKSPDKVYPGMTLNIPVSAKPEGIK